MHGREGGNGIKARAGTGKRIGKTPKWDGMCGIKTDLETGSPEDVTVLGCPEIIVADSDGNGR